MAHKKLEFDPEQHTTMRLFVENELIKEFKQLRTGAAMGTVMVKLLRDYVCTEQLKREFRKLKEEEE